MFKNILVPISFKVDREVERPLKLAETLLAENGQITLLHVIEHLSPHAASYMPKEYTSDMIKQRTLALNGLAYNMHNTEVAVIEGHSGRTILDWAAKVSPDLMIVASHRPDMRDAILGSTATQIVKHASCSVLVVR